jgi:hypothetical protein
VDNTSQFTFDTQWQFDALSQISSALAVRAPLVVVTGPPGAGKTRICRVLTEQSDDRTFTACVPAPFAGVNGFLRELLSRFGAMSTSALDDSAIGDDRLREALRVFLDGLASLHARCLIIIDDAHLISPDVTEEILGLISSANGKAVGIHTILVGNDLTASRSLSLGLSETEIGDSRRFTAIVGALAAASVIAGLILWPGRSSAPAAKEAVKSSSERLDGLIGTLSAADGAAKVDTPQQSTGVLPAESADAAAFRRRGAELARNGDIKGLVALRNAIASRAGTGTASAAEFKSVLAFVDDALQKARLRQLAIDRQRLLDQSNERQ